MNTELLQVIEGLEEGILILGNDQQILGANSAICSMLSVDKEEILAHKCYEVIHKSSEAVSLCPFEKAKNSGFGEASFYEPSIKRDLKITIIPLKNGNGEKVYLHTFYDNTEKNNLKNSLNHTRMLLDAVLSYCPNPMVVIGDDYKVQYINSGARFLSGRKEISSQDRSCFEVVYAMSSPCGDCRIKDVLESKKPISDEKTLTGKEGTLLHFRRYFYPLISEHGEIESVVEVLNDITDLRRIQERLRQKERFLEAILEGIGDAVLVIDPEFRIIKTNQGFLRQLDLSPEEVKGKCCYELSHGLDVPCFEIEEECPAKRCFQDAMPHMSVHRHRTKKGRTFFVEVRAYPLIDETGRVYAVVETILDVTTKIHLQRKLLESELRYRSLYHNAPVLLVTLDRHGRIMEFNETFSKTLGFRREDLLESDFGQLLSGTFKEEFEQNCLRVFREGYSCEGEFDIKRSDGTTLTFLGKATVVKDMLEDDFRINVTLTDITELKRLQREKDQLQSQLWQKQKMEALGILASGIAHDFNNILMGITGYTQIAMNRTTEDETRKTLEKILDTVERARTLTEQILTFGKREITRKAVININQFIKNSMQSIRRMVEESKEIVLQLQEPLPEIMADDGQLYQLLLNLIANAADAIHERGRITVKTGFSDGPCVFHRPFRCLFKSNVLAERGYIWFSVEDTGRGIEPQYIDRLFDPFFTTKGPSGTGLGLSVVYNIVKNHQGCIDLWTEPGKGTEFVVLLPVTTEKEEHRHPHTVRGIDEGVSKISSVLVVEDAEMVRDVIKGYFELMGIGVTAISTGDEAINILKEQSEAFDLVLIDWILPGLSGEKLIRSILAINPDQKIIISTGYAEDEKLQTFLKNPNIKLLKKPFQLSDLKRVLLSYCGSSGD